MVFGNNSFFMKFKTYLFFLKLPCYYKREESAKRTQSWMKVLETVSASEQKLCILNLKELKLLVTKNLDCCPFR